MYSFLYIKLLEVKFNTTLTDTRSVEVDRASVNFEKIKDSITAYVELGQN